jgi:microcin C transport system substrate-binding protein
MRSLGLSIALVSLSATSLFAAPRIIESNSISLHAEPKYPPGFTHFDYTNPDAPKGGTLRQAAIGTYDNFNLYAQRGDAAVGADTFYDTLMVPSLDEIEVYYALIAKTVEYPDDYSWIIFHIDPRARHQDGKPITADDVVFSFDKFMSEGVPQFKQYYAGVAKAEALDPERAKFTLKKGDRALLVSLAQLNVLPRQYWQNRKLSEPLTEVPLGSGAYTVKDFKSGQYVVYDRIADYWAQDLPVNKGQNNFDHLRYDYYRDETVAFEAFKAGEFDFQSENVAKNWATMYSGRPFDSGLVKKEEIPHKIPQGMQAFVFNTKRPFFADRRVRQALGYALDFEWMNKNFFYGQYTRARSYFTNTDYEARGLPGPGELKILQGIKGKIPDEVFTQEYQPPVTDGSGTIRDQLRLALDLLGQAGWELRDEKLVDAKTGQAMSFELLLDSPTFERIAEAMKKNLARMGVTMNIRVVDPSQFINRLRDRDFDLIWQGYEANFYPSLDLKIVWRSDYLDSTYNTAGVQDPAVDYLIDGIVASQENQAALLDWGRALDRVLTWNFYVIPQWYISKFRIAYWDKFARPALRPLYSLGTGSWWIDSAKEAKLPKR